MGLSMNACTAFLAKDGLIPILTDEEFSLNETAPRHKEKCPDIGY
jgi:hypothetical protein